MLTAKEFLEKEPELAAQGVLLHNLRAKLRHASIYHGMAVRSRNRCAAQQWLAEIIKLYREIDTICFEHPELTGEVYP